MALLTHPEIPELPENGTFRATRHPELPVSPFRGNGKRDGKRENFSGLWIRFRLGLIHAVFLVRRMTLWG